ncbi:Na+/H+ antiporter [Marihabitans asiaticum]|uniref:Sodium/proton antiporter (CPA1 family) n=1 Tax=Marihabitans asiaticum TaxID=415218 RepID=A0A560W753_9MICO|nr:Na+/H+ antiporter [Marihabitans asiaticum]TWD13335.1 sodium/proton antiporter (CPA1 family) [Marihabitans asiaticum]
MSRAVVVLDYAAPVEIAAVLLALAVTVLVGASLSTRIGVPAPLLLVLIGVLGSYLPHVPAIELSPEIVLVGLLPPLLYTAAIQTSLVEFTANRGAILALSIGLVVATTVVVAIVTHALIPGLGWPAAFAIGAVVAPPDAVAATAVGRRIGLPRRVVTILEGESLFNDATALVALRTAVAAIGGGVAAGHVALDFAIAAGGGVLAGLLVFVVVARVRRLITDPVLDTAVSLLTPFAAYLLAETIEASGVISVVVAGLLLGHKAPIIQTARSRVTERTTWATIAFLLENAVFLLIGLQAQQVLAAVGSSELGITRVLLVCLATLATVVIVRLAWIFGSRPFLGQRRRNRALPPRQALLVGWAGMRGVVTLAAAYIIPTSTPHREVLLVIAFTVVAGTLFVQGLTLPWLTRTLRVPAPDPRSDALARATLLHQAEQAGLRRLDEVEDAGGHDPDDEGIGTMIRTRVEQRTFAAWEQLGTRSGAESPSERYTRLRQEMIGAERAEVLRRRTEGDLPSEVVQEVLGMLDVEETMLESAWTAHNPPGDHAAPVGTGGCSDLDAHARVEMPPGESCEACLREGTRWVALRRCLTCGEVACCDSSVARHASAHYRTTAHPVVQSAEPGELWRWCFVHEQTG